MCYFTLYLTPECGDGQVTVKCHQSCMQYGHLNVKFVSLLLENETCTEYIVYFCSYESYNLLVNT